MRCGDKKAGSLTYSILSDNWYVIVLRHRDVLVRGYVHDVVIACGAEVIARHPRSCERHDFIFDPLHYLALIEQKINALDQAAPLAGWRLPEEFMTLEARMNRARSAG
jgi:hypothetical protein